MNQFVDQDLVVRKADTQFYIAIKEFQVPFSCFQIATLEGDIETM